jgi:hypothetical protein
LGITQESYFDAKWGRFGTYLAPALFSKGSGVEKPLILLVGGAGIEPATPGL